MRSLRKSFTVWAGSSLASIREAAAIAGAGNSVLVIGVDCGRAACAIGDGDDRALMVRMKPARRTSAVPDQRIVGRRVASVDVAGTHRADTIKLGNERIAVIQEARGSNLLLCLGISFQRQRTWPVNPFSVKYFHPLSVISKKCVARFFVLSSTISK
jgi:hypothetical protein